MIKKHIIELYKADDGFRARIKAGNGEIIFHNAQGITNLDDLVETIDNFIKSIKNDDFKVDGIIETES